MTQIYNIIDAHCHVFPDRIAEKSRGAVLGFAETEQETVLLARLRKIKGCLEVTVHSAGSGRHAPLAGGKSRLQSVPVRTGAELHVPQRMG